MRTHPLSYKERGNGNPEDKLYMEQIYNFNFI